MRVTLGISESVIVSGTGVNERNAIELTNIEGRLFSNEPSTPEVVSGLPQFEGFLHRHPKLEAELNIDSEHVIVDKLEWQKIRKHFGLP